MAKNSKEYATYSDQLKSPKWQKKRLEILNLHKFTCDECNNDDELQLHVHHRFYLKNRLAWEYDNDVFQVLCEKCHGKIHDKTNQNNSVQELTLLEKDLLSHFDKLCEREKNDLVTSVYLYTEADYNEYHSFWDKIYFSFTHGFDETIFRQIAVYKEVYNLKDELYEIKKNIISDYPEINSPF